MLTEKLNNKLKEIRDILIELENLKIDIIAISNKEEKYFDSVSNKSTFFNRIYWNSIKLFIIDIHKLVNDKEHYSLNSVLNFAISNWKHISWKHEMSYEKLVHVKSQIESLVKEDLQSVKDLRDKYYAHNDKDKNKFKVSLNLKKCWQILGTIQDIYNQIGYNLNNETWMFNLYAQPPKELLISYKYNLIKHMYFEEIVKYPDDGTLIQLRKIIRN